MYDIAFFSSSPNPTIGSYRIWIKDLQYYLKEIGISTIEINEIEKLEKNVSKILIVDKSDENNIFEINDNFNGLVGLINPSGNKNHKVDFYITGSHEERLSIRDNKPVFVFPLVEQQYQNHKLKIHKYKQKLIIGYHGNPYHLNRLKNGLGEALYKFANNYEFKLNLIVSNPKDVPKKYISTNIEYEIIEWNINSILDEIYKIDIGFIVNISKIKIRNQFLQSKKGLYETDYGIRFKNKSNSGRLFPFIQLGIPIIADITPSNFHLLGGMKGGILAYDENSWYNALLKLKDYKNRTKYASENKIIFDREYNPIYWAEKLILDLNEML